MSDPAYQEYLRQKPTDYQNLKYQEKKKPFQSSTGLTATGTKKGLQIVLVSFTLAIGMLLA